MTFLPIVDRELRVRARQKGTYWFRLGAAGVTILVAGFLLSMFEQMASPGTFGGHVFRTLAWLIFGYCLLEGVRSTADCLSEEKRAGTLGLLFLTDLKGYDVVLGKLAATSLNSVYSLLAIFPPLAIPLIIGGVTAGEFWRLVLVLINALLLSLTIGLSVSAVSRRERRAWGGTLAIVGFLAVVPPLVPLLIPRLSSLPFFSGFSLQDSPIETLVALSPTTGFLSAFDASYRAASGQFWRSLVLVHLLAWTFLVAASYLLPRCWQDAPLRQHRSWLRRLQVRWRRDDAAARRRERHLWLNLNPIVWLAGRQEEPPLWPWLLVLSAGIVGMVASLLAFGSTNTAICLFLGALGVHLMLAIWMASQACYMLADARDSGVLELLLATPLTVKEIVEGHRRALKRLVFWPVVTLVSVELVILAGHVVVLGLDRSQPLLCWVLLVAGGVCLAIFVLDLYAVATFGLWMGLTSRKPSQALTKTVLFVLLLPQLSTFCCGVLWPVVGLVKNLIFINYGQDQLRRRFRAVVTEQFMRGQEGQSAPLRWAWDSGLSRSAPDFHSSRDRGQLPPVIPDSRDAGLNNGKQAR